MKQLFFFVLGVLFCLGIRAQDVRRVHDPVQEQQMTAQTKQLNQFIRRFNGEEDKTGKKLWPKDKLYRNKDLRKNYINQLFDNSNITINPESKAKFLAHVNGNSPYYLNLHNGSWFAEVKTTFEYEGIAQDLTLFLDFEAKGKGHQWVLSGLYFKPYVREFNRPVLPGGEIIHPMSHEVDFMPLNKAFRKPHNIVGYTPKDFKPDFLTLFAYDVKHNRLKFKSVNSVKYHFFQLDNYYFQISEFIRDGLNSGWLISNLVEIPDNEKAQFIKLIRYETF